MKSSRGSISGIGERIYRPLSWLCVIIVLLMQIDQIVADIAYLPQYERLTASIGDDVKIGFEFCETYGKPSCTGAQTFNLTAPNQFCTADHHRGHCIISAAPANHPAREVLEAFGWQDHCEICTLTIHGVTTEDAGHYDICLAGKCATTVTSISVLVIENVANSPSSTSERDSTTPKSPGASNATPSTRAKTTTDNPESSLVNGTDEPGNYRQTGTGLTFVVGVTVLVIAIIFDALYLYRKRRNKNKQLDQYHSPTASPLTNGNTTTVKINVNNADGCSIGHDGEIVHFREDPHAGFDT